jgi:hypothetical protein
MRAELLLLAGHALLVAWVVLIGPGAHAYQSSVPIEILPKETTREETTSPNDHLPLRGMEGFSGNQADACLRLQGFLINVIDALQEAGVPTSLDTHQVPARLEDSSCAINDPSLVPLLGELSAGWHATGRPSAGPVGED